MSPVLAERTSPVQPSCLLATFDALARIDHCRTPDEVREALLEALTPYGFKGFTLAKTQQIKSLRLHTALLVSWPGAANDRYMDAGLYRRDPVFQRSHDETEPFAWDLSIYDPSDKTHAEILAIHKQFGVCGGVAIPVSEFAGGRCILFLSGCDFSLTELSILALKVLAQHVVARTNALVSVKPQDRAPQDYIVHQAVLSSREREVMGWVAFGKSSRDTAAIMGISEHTVNDHISSAIEKLQAGNRTDAVMRAYLLNEITL